MNSLPNKNSNPHKATWLDSEMVKSLETLHRIDDKGFLYSINITGDYYNENIIKLLENINYIEFGCSTFKTHNLNDEILMCRNTDFKHTIQNENGTKEFTSLNVVVRTQPKNKYKSITISDAFFVYKDNTILKAGVLDDGKTDISNIMLLPYEFMDGVNEHGLAITILMVEVPKNEISPYGNITINKLNDDKKPKKIVISLLMRYIIDNCKNIDEAINLAKKYEIIPYKNQGNKCSHLFLTDITGRSVVLEWRKGEITVTETDVCTNFYVGYDDAEDVYNSQGILIEKAIKVSNTYLEYKYGYGHGYCRFAGIASALQRYKNKSVKEYKTVMREDIALGILYEAAQDPETEGTSMTQYSVIYNINKLSMSVWVRQNFLVKYEFSLNE